MNLLLLKTWVQARLTSGERGAALVEYAFLLILVVVVAIAAIGALGDRVPGKFTSADAGFTG
jgi:Flp pilus assembly pilin Flp